jgi:DNA modification methylase
MTINQVRNDDDPALDCVSVIHADARQALAKMPDSSFDCLITDPPFGIAITKNERDVGRPHWDRSKIAFDKSFWVEARRVLKPGANLVAMGHARSFARMSVAIEDAGFEISDTISWIHGQGYAAGFRHLDDELRRVGGARLAAEYAGWGNMLRPSFEPIVLARNLGSHDSLPVVIGAGGVGGLNVDAVRLSAQGENRSRTPGMVNSTATWRVDRPEGRKSSPPPAGRLPGNVLLQHVVQCEKGRCDDSCPVAEIRRQGLSKRGRNEDASRFYRSFYHHPKATKAERPEVNGVTGPSVKPVGVMDWLVNLTTRPGQLVLDPFAGTGTTLEACARAGVRAVGIEREAAYLPLLELRIARLNSSRE